VRENLEIQGLTARPSYSLDLVFDVFPALHATACGVPRDALGRSATAARARQGHAPASQLLCIDELSLGLAPIAVESLITAVGAIKSLGITLVLVEQSLNIAAALCERAVFLEKARSASRAPSTDLLGARHIAGLSSSVAGRDRG